MKGIALSPSQSRKLVTGLRQVYADLAVEQGRRSPPCYQRGDCCDFSKADHILFTSTLEAIYFQSETPADLLAPGIDHLTFGPLGSPPPTSRPSEAAARIPCPFLRDWRCTVHETRPLGCRVYFCAINYQEEMGSVYERYNDRIRRLADELGIEYRYAPFLARRS